MGRRTARPVRAVFNAFCDETVLPSGVFGPVECDAFSRLAFERFCSEDEGWWFWHMGRRDYIFNFRLDSSRGCSGKVREAGVSD